MKQIRMCIGLVLIFAASGCNSVGPATIPPPTVSQGQSPAGYYPSPFVTPPPSAVSASTDPATSADGLSWQTPRAPAASSNLVTARGATISRSTLEDAAANESPEAPIRIVENSAPGTRASVIPFGSANASATPVALAPQSANEYVEISQLPRPRGVLQAVPAASTPATSRVRGFIPAVPQQNAVPANSLPGSPPATIARPRFSSTAPSTTPAVHYDSAVTPAAYEQANPTPTAGANQWRSR